MLWVLVAGLRGPHVFCTLRATDQHYYLLYYLPSYQAHMGNARNRVHTPTGLVPVPSRSSPPTPPTHNTPADLRQDDVVVSPPRRARR